jgi:hypothetical protein
LEQSTALLVSTSQLGARFRSFDDGKSGDIGARRIRYRPVANTGCEKEMWVEELIHPGEGDEELSEDRDNDPRASDRGKPSSRRSRKPKEGGRSKPSELGRALRSVYDSTLREEIPDDFLDLLGKLS